MELNQKQKNVCKIFSNIFLSFKDSNDISSPKHFAEIEECVENLFLFEDIKESEVKELKDKLFDLYKFIEKLK